MNDICKGLLVFSLIGGSAYAASSEMARSASSESFDQYPGRPSRFWGIINHDDHDDASSEELSSDEECSKHSRHVCFENHTEASITIEDLITRQKHVIEESDDPRLGALKLQATKKDLFLQFTFPKGVEIEIIDTKKYTLVLIHDAEVRDTLSELSSPRCGATPVYCGSPSVKGTQCGHSPGGRSRHSPGGRTRRQIGSPLESPVAHSLAMLHLGHSPGSR